MCLEYRFNEEAQPGYIHEISIGWQRVNEFFGEYERDGQEVYYDRKVLEPFRSWLNTNTPGWRSSNFKVINCFSFQTKEHAMLFKLTWA